LAAEAFRALNAPKPPPHPKPPARLSETAAKHFRDIVATRPSTYFDAPNLLLLECMCNHMAQADWLAERIRDVDPGKGDRDFRRFRTLSVMICREERAILSLMTNLRLLPPK
jgi:hypothetical protein